MCGIFWLSSASGDGLAERAERALARLRPRGPDAQRLLFSRPDAARPGAARYHGALGAARLAMVDVGGPDQPLETPDGRYRIALHGELWNHAELRRDLEARGAAFATAGDTECVLHAVAAAGARAPDLLDGQFAYLVEDTRAGRLHVARDRNGICPLFYARLEGGLVLASTVRVLCECGARPEEVRALPQGYGATFELPAGAATFRRYHDPAADLAAPAAPVDLEGLGALLRASVAKRIPREVPYATIVGGIDSSLVTALCAREALPPRCLITVTTSADPDSGDVQNARLLSERLGLACHIGIVDEAYVEAQLDRVIDALASANILEVVTGIVGLKAAEMAREAGAKAIITGGGADEVFAGYDFVWTLFDRARLRENLLHVYQQSGNFECHREDGVTAAAGVEARPAYYDGALAAAVLRRPPEERVAGLGGAPSTGAVTEKVLLKAIARAHLPPSIVEAKKRPFYSSTSILALFERVARRLISEEEAVALRRRLRAENPAWLHWMFLPGRGPLLILARFLELYPGFAALPLPLGPPDYDDPASYGRFYGSYGCPVLAGFDWRGAGRPA